VHPLSLANSTFWNCGGYYFFCWRKFCCLLIPSSLSPPPVSSSPHLSFSFFSSSFLLSSSILLISPSRIYPPPSGSSLSPQLPLLLLERLLRNIFQLLWIPLGQLLLLSPDPQVPSPGYHLPPPTHYPPAIICAGLNGLFRVLDFLPPFRNNSPSSLSSSFHSLFSSFQVLDLFASIE